MPDDRESGTTSLGDIGPRFTRRRLLGGSALAGTAALASTALPLSVQKALAAPLPSSRGSFRDVEHVVLLMQENRSFDHYFGTFPGVRGFADPHALTLSTGRSVFYQPDPSSNPAGNPDGYLLPYHLNSLTTAAQAIPSTSHAWSVQHRAWDGGAMDSWLPAHIAADGPKVGPYTMGYYETADIPFQRALADAFTICDNYFCSVLGPTHPNRYMWMTGTVDPNGENGGPALDNNVTNGRYTWSTYAENLTAAGVTWKCYQESDNYGTNVLEFFHQYQTAPTSSPLYQNAMVAYPAGKFEYDAINDQLPTVSWIFPTSTQSEHPAYLPNAGAAFVASKIEAVAANPDVWAKTVFLLVYDENDGLFDHVPPPTPPAGTPDEFVNLTSPGGTVGNGLPVGPGFRVPLTIVSPWTAGGWVCSEAFDHTSHLRFLEKVTGVEASNISNFRRQTLGDLTSAFRFGDRPAAPPVLPDTTLPLALATYEVATFPLPPFPGADQTPPFQPRGRRPHVPRH
jgi:phospholipase C